MYIVKKIIAILLIIIGSILTIVVVLTLLNPKGIGSTDTAVIVGYYIGFVLILALAVTLIASGVRILKKLRSKKILKKLLDSLPGEEIDVTRKN